MCKLPIGNKARERESEIKYHTGIYHTFNINFLITFKTRKKKKIIKKQNKIRHHNCE